MDLKDIAYRAGLIFAAFLLAGIFAQQLVHISSRAADGQVQDTVDALRKAVGMLLSSSEGSSLIVSFGIEGGYGENALQLPGRFDGESYRLEFLPGLLALKWAGGREVVIEDSSIVPCHPPVKSQPINATQLDAIMECATGFRPMTPCRLQLSRPVGAQGSLFVNGLDDAITDPFMNLSKLLFSSPSPYPGSFDEVSVKAPFGAHIKEDLLIFLGDDDAGSEGPDSPVPFVIPARSSIETDGKEALPPGSVMVLRRETLLQPDGNCTVLTRLWFNPPRGWTS
ncbi:MAG: hypothetical protein MUC62_01375 [Candidatus Thermoplasmatota archaeon]|jgi:hypothetical protein|nr:hypothetical protein [Candidatus Thermoplasmatota archaeon]